MTNIDKNIELEARKIRYAWLKMEKPGPWTAAQVFDKIVGVMRMLPGLHPAVDCLDYALGEDYKEWAKMPRTAEEWEKVFRCYGEVNTGGSEGIYIDVYFHENWQATHRIPFGTFKTLRDDFGAYLLMGEISGAYTALFEEWQWANRPEVWNG